MSLELPGGVLVPALVWLPAASGLVVGAVVFVVGRIALGRERRRHDDAERRARDEHRRAAELRQQLAIARTREDGGPERRLLGQCGRFASELAACNTRDELAGTLGRAIERLLRPSQWAVYRCVDDSDRPYERVAAAGDLPPGDALRRLPTHCGRLAHVARRGEAMGRRDFEAEPEVVRRALARADPPGLVVDAAAPVLLEGRAELLVSVGGSVVPDGATTAVLGILASAATAAVRAQEARARAARAEACDSLTGLERRTVFASRAERLVQEAVEGGPPLALVVFEIDDLVEHEQSAGPIGIEILLRRFAECVRATLRPDDLLTRWSSKHYVGLLRDVDARGAFQAFDRVRQAVEGNDWSGTEAHGGRLTISAGVATCPANGRELAELWELATQNLSAARWGGGNQVSVMFVERVESEDATSPVTA